MQTPGECALHLSKPKLIMKNRASAELMIKSLIKSKYCLSSYCK